MAAAKRSTGTKRKPRRKTPQRKRESRKVPVVAEVSLRVLGYREEGEWIALALEMDLRGYGKTFDEALSDLTDLVAMQIHFALYKGASSAESVGDLEAPIRESRYNSRHFAPRVAIVF